MIYLKTFNEHENMNEGLKNWMSKFLLLASLGLVPPSISLGQNRQKQKEFVQNIDSDKMDAALFVDYLNNQQVRVRNLDSVYNAFRTSNKVSSNFSDVSKYISRNGNNYMFDSKYNNINYILALLNNSDRKFVLSHLADSGKTKITNNYEWVRPNFILGNGKIQTDHLLVYPKINKRIINAVYANAVS